MKSLKFPRNRHAESYGSLINGDVMSFPGRSSEPSIKKKKKKTSQVLPQTPQLYPILPLPDDLVLSCLARVSRLYYPTLSLVSKRIRSLLASPELYETRSLLGRTESCLYVCLKLPPHFNTSWFTLGRRPDLTLKKKKKKKMSSGNLLVPIPSLQSPPAHSSGLVAVASNIYNIGGPIEDAPSSSVSILDCKSHTWRDAPSMLVEREYPVSNVLDGNIYVAGGCPYCNSSNWMEVFDLKTHTWDLVSSPLPERCESRINRIAVIEGEILMCGDKGGVAYKPKQDRWEAIGELTDLDLEWGWLSYSVVDNVLYCYSNLYGLRWYDSKMGNWFSLMGLKGLPKFADYCRVKLADYGGKMAILWDKYVPSSGYKDKMIWCAVIALERRSSQEIWGNVEWLDAVLRVPKSYTFECALSATV